MQILFLDIDGVLNSHSYYAQWARRGKEQKLRDICFGASTHLLRLFELIPDLKVVVSSTWRIGRDGTRMGQELFALKALDHPSRVLDVTPRLPGRPRGQEIQKWLTDFPQPVECFAILDDDSDMEHLKPYLLQTSTKDGLLYSEVDRLVEFFEWPWKRRAPYRFPVEMPFKAETLRGYEYFYPEGEAKPLWRKRNYPTGAQTYWERMLGERPTLFRPRLPGDGEGE